MDDILLGLISVSKVFTIDFVNKAIASFEYSKIDRKNKPQPLKIISSANFKNKQTACEMWNLIRFLPLILGPHITKSNIYWDLYINFCQLVKGLGSLTFYSTEMIILSEHTKRFFTKYMDVFEGTRLKSKACFIMHYPDMIERISPLVKTLRFESKEGYFKGLYSNNKNRKNVCQYMAKRHQFMIYLHHNNKNILPHNDAIGIKVSEIPVETLDFKHKNTVLDYINLKDTDLLHKLFSIVFDLW